MKRVITASVQHPANRAAISPGLLQERLRPWQGSCQLKTVRCFLPRISYPLVVSVKPDFHLRLTAGFSVPPHSCSRDLPDCASPPQGTRGGCPWVDAMRAAGRKESWLRRCSPQATHYVHGNCLLHTFKEHVYPPANSHFVDDTKLNAVVDMLGGQDAPQRDQDRPM